MSGRSFTPAWWLPGPHLQTMWGKWIRRTRLPLVSEHKLPTDDGDELTIVRLEAMSGQAPRVLFLHGLEGTRESHYVRGFFSEAASRGWGVDLLLFRTCDGRLNAAPRTYHSGETSDPAFVLRQLLNSAADAPIALVGVSLGGNVLLRLLSELSDSESSRITAAVAVSTPYDLARSCKHLQTGASRVYQWHFVRKLRRKALAKVAQYPSIADSRAIANARSFLQFDDAFTSVVHGFRDAADYYERCSSVSILEHIRVPTLLLSARDDPFHPPELLDDVAARAANNSAITVEFLAKGGHAGFVGGSLFRPQYYAEWRAAEFIASHGRARDESIDQHAPLAAR